MKKLNEIFELCVEKGLFFNFSPHVKSISVHSQEMNFEYYSYYEGSLVDLSMGNLKTLPELIELIENYNNEMKLNP